MDSLKIIFWVCIVEAFLGHLPWTAPLAVLGVYFLFAVLEERPKKKTKSKEKKND